MAAVPWLIDLTGRWNGTYRLIVDSSGPARDSKSSAVVVPVAGGRFARIDYTRDFEGNAAGRFDPLQEGSLETVGPLPDRKRPYGLERATI